MTSRQRQYNCCFTDRPANVASTGYQKTTQDDICRRHGPRGAKQVANDRLRWTPLCTYITSLTFQQQNSPCNLDIYRDAVAMTTSKTQRLNFWVLAVKCQTADEEGRHFQHQCEHLQQQHQHAGC